MGGMAIDYVTFITTARLGRTSTLVISLAPPFFSLTVGKEVAPVERNVWASLKDRLCKSLYTGGSCKKTASVNGLFTLAVCISQPPV